MAEVSGYDNYLYLDKGLSPPHQPGVLEVSPVILPEGDGFCGRNGHLGWPVSAKAPFGYVILFHRRCSNPDYRWGETNLEVSDEFSSAAVSLKLSPDFLPIGSPEDLKTVSKVPTQGCRLGFGNSMGITSHGDIIALTPYGLFLHSINESTWKHIPEAYGEKQLKGPVANNGPALINHPLFGLLAFGHVSRGTNPDGTEKIMDELWVRSSSNSGKSWSETCIHLPDFVKPVEPAALFHEGRIILLARCHKGGEKGIGKYVQLVSRENSLDFSPGITNITATEIPGHPWHGPWSQDTASIIYNHVTCRVEAVVTNRNGGGQGMEKCGAGMSLNLWSMDPGDLLSGKSRWRFEGTLLQRRLKMVDGLDGMHPGGSALDLDSGMQHLFCYMGLGWFNMLEPGRKNLAGIFRISRTLDTPRLFPAG